MQPLHLTPDNFNREQLLVLNELLQFLPLEQRADYLQNLGDIFHFIEESPKFFIDTRDYNIYTVLSIGDQHWLGENLRYRGVDHWYNEQNPNLFYGCLYDWATLMGLDSDYNNKLWGGEYKQHRGIAPEGWHIPSDVEWKILEEELYRFEVKKGAVLKAAYNWHKGANGSDNIGFNAFPAGSYWSGSFDSLGLRTSFWSATEYSHNYAWFRSLSYLNKNITHYYSTKEFGGSCRCILTK